MDFIERLKLAWRILWGKSGVYGAEFEGKVRLDPKQDVHVIACKFEPDTAELREDGGQDCSYSSGR